VTSAAPPALALLLNHAADMVQGVQAGRSLTDLLADVPAAARPGTQALTFHALRRLGGARAARALMAPKPPPREVDSLLLTALALLWPPGPGERAPYPDHTLVDQAVHAARRRVGAAAGFINAVLRRFVRERDALATAAARDPVGAYNHPLWWIERVRRDWPGQWEALLTSGQPASADGAAREPAPRGPRRSTCSGWQRKAWRRRPRATPGGGAGRALPGAARCPASPKAMCRCRTCRPSSLRRCWWRQGAGPAARPGARVLDACAAPGGKTAHLLELGAYDVTGDRLRRAAPGCA
jgi:16S rRNA (cytosine967-C5)-methyltransferase